MINGQNNIGGLGTAYSAAYQVDQADKAKEKAADKTVAGAAAAEAKKNEDAFVKGDSTGSVTYQPKKKLTADDLKEISNQQVESFQKMLSGMLSKQGQAYNLTMGGKHYQVTPEVSAKAAEAIAPGGEWSVDAVSTRILDMAQALAGGDKSKIGILRDAVEKGFKAAGVELGVKKMPEITGQTYDEVMKRFDQWEKGEPIGGSNSDSKDPAKAGQTTIQE